VIRIVYTTDIHDALKELRVLLTKTEADLYLLSGDILYHAFYDDMKVYEFVCLQEEFYALAKEEGRSIVPYDLATEILRNNEGGYPAETVLKAAEYRILFHRASRTMKEKYGMIEDLIRKYGNAASFVLPGNYDIDLRYTALSSRNLHKNTMYFENLTLAGYGGAPIATSGIPEKLAVPYQEAGRGVEFYSEPYDFFVEVEPDILVLHNPAYGYFDRIPTLGHVGSNGIRNYLDDHPATLVLSGHVHEDYGVMMKSDGTVLMNPSNFGGVDSPYGFQHGGLFAEILIDTDSRSVQEIFLKRLKGNQICDLLHVRRDENRLVGELMKDAAESSIDLGLFLRDRNGTVIDL
jgi:Icc-related predicted phosphoesterase